MMRKRSRSGSRHVLYAVLGCVLLVVVAIVSVRLRQDPAGRALVAQTSAAAAVIQQRQQEVRAAAEQARSTLPADAGISRDWNFAGCCDSLRSAQVSPPLQSVILYMHEVLGDDLNSGTDSDTGRAAKYSLGTPRLPPPVESMDLSRHSKDEVLDSIGAYLSGLRQLDEAEVAYERGVLVVDGPGAPQDGRAGFEPVVGEALACRAICEARRGDVHKAARSYANAQGIRRAVTDAYAQLPSSDLWYVQRMADFAWRGAPFSVEERERLVECSAQQLPSEELTRSMLAHVEQGRSMARERLSDLRKRPFGFIGTLVLGYEWGRQDKKLSVLPSRLPVLFAQPSRQAIEAMDEMAAAAADGSGYGYLRVDVLLDTAARLHLQNSRVDTIRQTIRVAFALKDYKKTHGEYPKQLEGLVPDPILALPTDPFVEKPLTYGSDGKTFTISYPEAQSSGKSQVMRRLFRAMRHNPCLWRAQE